MARDLCWFWSTFSELEERRGATVSIIGLVFKGTHNSCACVGHSLDVLSSDQQIGHFGLWPVELTSPSRLVDGELRVFVRHDDEEWCFSPCASLPGLAHSLY
jgi:hypothetical protein